MVFYIQLQDIAVCVLLFATLWLGLFFISFRGNKCNTRRPPEPAGAWPIFGHLPLLGANKLLHKVLGGMADELGPLFSLRIGSKPTLVISSWELVKECFTTNDKVLSTRPRSLSVQIMGYDHAVLGFAPYGPYWSDLRKIVVIGLLSARRLDMLKHVRDSEVNLFIEGLYEQWRCNGGKSPKLVEMKERFGFMAMNIVVRMVAGKRYYGTGVISNKESRQFQKAVGDFFHLTGLLTVSDAVPFLGWLDAVKGYKAKMRRTANEMDCVLGSWVEEHRQKRLMRKIDESEHDFIHVMLSILDDDRQRSLHDASTVIKATCLSLILGGNDTTVITLTWALSLLLNNRHVLSKAQDELDIHVGRHRQVDESDVKNLTYLNAIVKETLRLYPALPLSVARETMEDCTISGFDIPAGTRLLVNLWKLHRDPSVWTDPLEFQPERFLGQQANLDIKGQDFELIPFGAGRRMCPGVTFAVQVLHLTLARLLHGFELGTVSDSPVDMTESSGLSNPKATPLEVTLSPRLSSMLYKY